MTVKRDDIYPTAIGMVEREGGRIGVKCIGTDAHGTKSVVTVWLTERMATQMVNVAQMVKANLADLLAVEEGRHDNADKCSADECGGGTACREDNGYSSYCSGCLCSTCTHSTCRPPQ